MILVLFLFVAAGCLCWVIWESSGRKIKVSKTTKKIQTVYNKEKRTQEISQFINKYLKWFSDVLESNAFLNKQRQQLVRKMLVLCSASKEKCEQSVTLFMFYLMLGACMEAAMVIVLMPSWYLVLGICGVTVYLVFTAYKDSLEKKVDNLYLQLPEALQVFLDNYIISGNVKVALDAVPLQMKGDICFVFEKLSRKLSSGADAQQSIYELAEDLDYVWAYAFAEILCIAISSSGDISEDIQFLITTINDSIEEKMSTKAELNGSRNISNGLNFCAMLGLVIEFVAFPFARNFYLYTSTGNLLILFFILEVVAVNAAFVLMEDL